MENTVGFNILEYKIFSVAKKRVPWKQALMSPICLPFLMDSNAIVCPGQCNSIFRLRSKSVLIAFSSGSIYALWYSPLL